MPESMREADWQVFRELRVVALERFCERVLVEVGRIASERGKSYHERYLDIYQLLQTEDKDLERAFNDPRRSVALLQLLGIQALGLLTDDEIARFGPEPRAFLKSLTELRNRQQDEATSQDQE